MEESFIRVLIVILTDVSSVQIIVHDKRFNIVLGIETMTVRTTLQHGKVPVTITGHESACVYKDDKRVKQRSQQSGIWVNPPKW